MLKQPAFSQFSKKAFVKMATSYPVNYTWSTGALKLINATDFNIIELGKYGTIFIGLKYYSQ